MLNNFIYAKTKTLFEEALNNGEVLDEAIAFIEDTKEIWNHGTYFDCSDKHITEENLNEVLSEYITEAELNLKGYLTEHQDISGKQDTLVSGTNIKTINGISLLGSEDITINGGSVYTFNYTGLSSITQEEWNAMQLAEIIQLVIYDLCIPVHVAKQSSLITFIIANMDVVPFFGTYDSIHFIIIYNDLQVVVDHANRSSLEVPIINTINKNLNLSNTGDIQAYCSILQPWLSMTFMISDSNGNCSSRDTVYIDTEEMKLHLFHSAANEAVHLLFTNGEAYYHVEGFNIPLIGNIAGGWYSQSISKWITLPETPVKTARVGDFITFTRVDVPASDFYSKYVDFNSINLELGTVDRAAFNAYKSSLGLSSLSDGLFIKFLIVNGYIRTSSSNPKTSPSALLYPLAVDGMVTTYVAQITPNTENFYSGEFWTENMTGPGIYSYVTKGRPAGSEDGEFYTGYISPDGTQTLISMKDPSKAYTRAKIGDTWTKLTFGVGKNTGGTGEIFNDYINNKAHEDHAHAEGLKTNAYSYNAHAEGYNTQAGHNAHSEGSGTHALGQNSHAEGLNTLALGNNSHSEGHLTQATNYNSHAEGYRTHATGNGAHAEGNSDGIDDKNYWNVASGFASHVEGNGTRAEGKAAHAEGWLTYAKGDGAHAEGYDTLALNHRAHAEGFKTYVDRNNAHAEGCLNYYEGLPAWTHAVGIGNTTANALNPNSPPIRRNAHLILNDGKHYIYGIGGYEGQGIENAKDLATVINSNKGNAWSILDYEFVDLGLSVRWASCNVGAESPEEFGDYFAWGETTPKNTYSSVDCFAHDKSMELLKSNGVINDNNSLIAVYDAATANWGARWRMSTHDEMKELIDNCTWEWTSVNGINGYQVTGPNSNSIFLPAAGKIDGSTIDYTYSYYWNSTKIDRTSYVSLLNFRVGNYLIYYENPYYGGLIRPVTNF